jgi:uncharacterized radical SAM superfamily protein
VEVQPLTLIGEISVIIAWHVMFGLNQPKIQQLFLAKRLLASELNDVTLWGQLINVYY